MTIRGSIGVALIAALCAGCVERTSYETSDESDRVSRLILDAAPKKIDHRIGADLGGKVELLGCDLPREEVDPGKALPVVWYWKCNEAPGPGWRLFTHVVDAEGRSRLNRDSAGPIRQHFQPEHWRPGMVIKDPQRIEVPASWDSPALELRVGIWRGEDRMEVISGPEDGSERVIGARVEIGEERAEPVAVAVPWIEKAPQLDGDPSGDPAWSGAAVIGQFFRTVSGQPEKRRTTEVRLARDAENLYVAMVAADDFLRSEYDEHDDELWHQDAFEVFLDPKGDKKHYYEIQVSPAGVVFDSHLPSYRKNRNSWSSEARVAVARDGELNDDAADRGWSAEIAIPFAGMKAGGGVPPRPDESWRANFFRVDVTRDEPVYTAWSPPLRGDFHALDRFALLRFPARRQEERADSGPAGSDGESGGDAAAAGGGGE
jgi:hypothetical protein